MTPYAPPAAPDLGPLLLIALSFCLIVYLAYAIPFAGVLRKTGRGGGAAYVPLYNSLTLLDIIGRPWWWLLLCGIPFVNIVFVVIVLHDLSRSFGKDAAFTVGLICLPWVFLMILWLGESTYHGPIADTGRMTAYVPGEVAIARPPFVLPDIPNRLYRVFLTIAILAVLLVAIINHGPAIVVCCLLGVGLLTTFLVLG